MAATHQPVNEPTTTVLDRVDREGSVDVLHWVDVNPLTLLVVLFVLLLPSVPSFFWFFSHHGKRENGTDM